MRILMVNWAKVWDGARIGGGANGYMQALALDLAGLGHEISCLSTGTEEVPDVDPLSFVPSPGPIQIRRHDDWRGIRIFEVVNSPILAPAIFQMSRPEAEITCPPLAGEVARFMALLRPDVIHLHNIEGLTADCVPAFQSAGGRVVFSAHNYHAICPQVYLMQEGLRPCMDFEGGRACERCAAALEPQFDHDRERLRRWHGAMRRLGVPIAPVTLPTIEGHLPLPFRPIADPVDVELPRPFPVDELRGVPQPPSPPAAPCVPPSGPPTHLEPLTNQVVRDSIPDPTERFGVRRAAMLTMLNACDAVHAVSSFVEAKLQSLGVRASILQMLTIGSRAATLTPHTGGDRAGTGNLSLAFLGYNNRYKGLAVLLDAIELLAPADAARIDLRIHALDLASLQARLDRLAPKLARLHMRDGYRFEELPEILRDVDLGVVPSVWWDNGPQTVMEFLACGVPVLGARVGGIPDFVQDQQNGILFTANDRADLAAKLTALVQDIAQVGALRACIRPMKSMHAHAREIEALYRELTSSDLAGLASAGAIHAT